MAERIRVVYISGWGRSGSTVLCGILGQLDGFFAAGELYDLWSRGVLENLRCGCGSTFSDCSTWSEILRRTAGAEGVLPFQDIVRTRNATASTRRIANAFVPGLRRRWETEVSPFREVVRKLYRAIVDVTGTRIIVDSTKRPLYGHLLATTPGMDVSVIHLVRDPRATGFSWQRQKLATKSTVQNAAYWMSHNGLTEMLFRGSGKAAYLRVRYEDLVADPKATLGQVVRSLGEDPAALPFVGSHEVRMQPTHTVYGNPSRFGQRGSVVLRPDDEWRERIRPSDRALCTALTLPLVLRYGYGLSGLRSGSR